MPPYVFFGTGTLVSSANANYILVAFEVWPQYTRE